MDEKLQKVLARVGLGSRREMERWIEQGRVKVNDKEATIGDRVSAKDSIKVDNKIINQKRTEVQQRVIAYHKPVGEVCTRDDPEVELLYFLIYQSSKAGVGSVLEGWI